MLTGFFFWIAVSLVLAFIVVALYALGSAEKKRRKRNRQQELCAIFYNWAKRFDPQTSIPAEEQNLADGMKRVRAVLEMILNVNETVLTAVDHFEATADTSELSSSGAALVSLHILGLEAFCEQLHNFSRKCSGTEEAELAQDLIQIIEEIMPTLRESAQALAA